MTEKTPEQIEKEKKQKRLSDLETYAYGAVAGKALAGNDFQRANVSLDKLISSMFGEDERLGGLLAGIASSEEASKTASQVYASKYQEALGKSKVSDLWNFYSSFADKYAGDSKPKANEEIQKFANLEFGKIQDKYIAAKEITESKTSNFSKEQKESAEKDLKKYEKVMATIQTLQNAYLDKYEGGVTDQSRKNLFQQLYGQDKKE